MELRHLRYFVAIGEEQHYGRAARRLRVAQPALSRQIQDLEEEVGFKLFERLPRGVKLSVAGKLFLEDARRILQEISEAAVRAGRVASGRSGTLRIGFTENSSWRGVVPDFLPPIPGAATRRRTAASTRGESGAVRGDKIRSSGCGVRQFHAEIRSGIEPASRGPTTRRAGRSQKPSAHKAQESPPAGPDGSAVHLVSKAVKPGVLRPADAQMLSRRPEVSPHRSGRSERANYPKSRVDRHGRGMGPCNGTLAVP